MSFAFVRSFVGFQQLLHGGDISFFSLPLSSSFHFEASFQFPFVMDSEDFDDGFLFVFTGLVEGCAATGVSNRWISSGMQQRLQNSRVTRPGRFVQWCAAAIQQC